MLLKKYSFGLQSILNLRNIEEKESMFALASAQKRLQEEKDALEELKNQKYQVERVSKNKMTIQDLRAIDVYKRHLSEQIVNKEMDVKAAKENLRKTKEKLLKAHKEKKIMETLREKDYEVHKENERKEEERQIDEFNTSRHTRR